MCVICLTEAESELGNKQEVVHASTSSSLVVGSSNGNELTDSEDYREKASPHMADSDMVSAVRAIIMDISVQITH